MELLAINIEGSRMFLSLCFMTYSVRTITIQLLQSIYRDKILRFISFYRIELLSLGKTWQK